MDIFGKHTWVASRKRQRIELRDDRERQFVERIYRQVPALSGVCVSKVMSCTVCFFTA